MTTPAELQPFDGKLDSELVPFDGKLDQEKTSAWEDVKSGFAQVGNMVDKGWTLAASNLASDKEKEEMFRNMEARIKSREDFAGITGKEQGLGGKLISVGATLPSQIVAAPLSAIETAMEFIKNGESLEDAYKAAGVDAAFTAAGFAVPAAFGKTLLQKALTGGGAGAVQDVLARMAISNVAENKVTQEQFAPNMEDAAVSGLIGAGFGASMPTRVNTASADKIAPRIEPVMEQPVVAPEIPRQGELDMGINPYDAGGGVSKLSQEQPIRIDDPQMDLFQDQQTFVPKQEIPVLDEVTMTPENTQMADAFKKAQEEAAYRQVEEQAERTKQIHYDNLQDLELAKRNGDFDYQYARDNLKDKTLMAPEANQAMYQFIKDGNISSAIKSIADNHSNSEYRKLATYLSDKLDGLNVKLHEEMVLRHGDRDVTGYFDGTSSTIGFSGVGAASPHTVLHETIHGLTSQFITTRPNDLRVMGLKSLYNKLQSIKGTSKFPSVTNLKEFVAEAFSNPEFQNFLKDQRMDNRTLFQKFMDGVKNMLGIKGRTPLSNAFEQVIDLGKQVIEASDVNTRKEIENTLKASGMPNKLVDLMAVDPKKPNLPVVKNEAVEKTTNRIPGLKHAVSDFAFYTEPVEKIIEMAKMSPDIPDTALEKLSHQLQAGALFESLKTRNPVVKSTYERLTRATQEAAHNIKKYLTDPQTGLKRYMRDLDDVGKGEIWAFMMMHEGKTEFASSTLAEIGFTEKQIAYYNKYRELSDQFFQQINERRVAMGMAPMDRRVAHIAGRFLGDFSRFIKDPETGRIVGRIAGNTKWELNRATKYMQKKHPDYDYGKVEYNTLGKGRSNKDRFSGLMEAINFLEKADPDVQKIMDSYRGYLQTDAINYLNATRHAKAKVREAGGIKGSEGNKPWLALEKNAIEGMKAQLAYFEQGYEWMAMEKAVQDINPLLGDEGVIQQAPNAVAYATAYRDHALGRNQGVLNDAANWTASKFGELSGFGHSNIFKANAKVKHLMMQKFMGFMNIPFTVTQLLQPLQTQPALMTLLASRGLDLNVGMSQFKATQTYAKAMKHGEMFGKLDDFEKEMVKYAEEMGIYDVKMADHTKDINSSKSWELLENVADFNIKWSEHLTRGVSFMFYAHLLKDAGIPRKDILGAAENMTNMTMVNYHPLERPMGYAKLGWLGDIASTLTRYKHNQLSQLAFYAREGIRQEQGLKSATPFAAMLATSIAFGGIMGFFGYEEANAAYELLAEKVFKKPDSLTNIILKSDMPEVISHGVFSTLGVDMTTRFSNANIIPNSIPEALMPYGSAMLDMAAAGGKLTIDPTSTTKQKQALKSFAPQSVAGLLENQLFTEQDSKGRNMYVNNTDGPNLGRGRIDRSEDDMTKRAWGFRNIRESKQLAKGYANSQVEKGNANIAEKQLTKAKYLIMDGDMTPEKFAELARTASEYGMSPDSFVNHMVKWSQERNMTQLEQQQLRNAMSGFRGAFNISQGR